jgi:hypothetical protein
MPTEARFGGKLHIVMASGLEGCGLDHTPESLRYLAFRFLMGGAVAGERARIGLKTPSLAGDAACLFSWIEDLAARGYCRVRCQQRGVLLLHFHGMDIRVSDQSMTSFLSAK